MPRETGLPRGRKPLDVEVGEFRRTTRALELMIDSA